MREYRERQLSEDLQGERLRDLVHDAELGVASLKTSGSDAVNLLRVLDRIADMFDELDPTSIDIRAEKTRMTTIGHQLRRKARDLLADLRSSGGLAALREARPSPPPRARWWWYLDEIQRQLLVQKLRRTGIIVAVAAAVLVVANILYQNFLAPSPLEQEKQTLVLEAESSLSQGDLEASLRQYEAALALDATDPELHIWAGVLAERLERPAEAEPHYAEAERLIGDLARFLYIRGNAHLRTGALDAAIEDAEEAISISPESAEPHLVLGSVYDARGEYGPAMDQYQITADLADAAGNDVLHVIAKMRVAMMLQAGPRRQTE